MRFLIIILLFSKVVSQDIGQKMIDNGDYESALNYYQYLLCLLYTSPSPRD